MFEIFSYSFIMGTAVYIPIWFILKFTSQDVLIVHIEFNPCHPIVPPKLSKVLSAEPGISAVRYFGFIPKCFFSLQSIHNWFFFLTKSILTGVTWWQLSVFWRLAFVAVVRSHRATEDYACASDTGPPMRHCLSHAELWDSKTSLAVLEGHHDKV